mmetsp:Transcript_2623/g.3900  ORF Transcript_2623/g.3900 Transcript_2623/m.3900 type:complete len:419 (+) Transcript_2623:98-1354(+)
MMPILPTKIRNKKLTIFTAKRYLIIFSIIGFLVAYRIICSDDSTTKYSFKEFEKSLPEKFKSFKMIKSPLVCPTLPYFKILCATVVGDKDNAINNLIANVIETKGKCNWAIISYSNNATKLQNILESTAKKGAKIITILNGDMPPNTPKVVFWLKFKEFANKYEFIWLLDEDMSFYKFDFETFTSSLAFSFPEGVPLLSQPVLWTPSSDGSTPINQNYDEKHRGKKIKNPFYWMSMNELNKQAVGLENAITAAKIGFVEIQAPLIDAELFGYILEEALLVDAALKTGSNWGLDFYMCDVSRNFSLASAARENGVGMEEIEKSLRFENGAEKMYKIRPFCAVIVAAPLLHLDYKTIPKSKEWSERGHLAIKAYKEKFKGLGWAYWKEINYEKKPMGYANLVRNACLKQNRKRQNNVQRL